MNAEEPADESFPSQPTSSRRLALPTCSSFKADAPGRAAPSLTVPWASHFPSLFKARLLGYLIVFGTGGQ